jgi:zinc transport system ATP-binding protein
MSRPPSHPEVDRHTGESRYAHEHRGHHHPAADCGDAGHAPRAFGADALISARSLTFRRGGRAIVDGIDLDITCREIVTLIGPNGAGKTTLVRLLLGLEQPDSGEVRRWPGLVIGYAPQRFDIDRSIPMTVARFLALGLPRAGPGAAEARKVLAEVGAERAVGQQLAELSGGELQRVVLARALLRDPHLLVLDEPVRGIDFAGEAELYTLIGRLRSERGLGVLLVSHDLHVVMASSDRVLCINRHVCCSGVPDAVAQHPEYARLFGAEAARAFAIYGHHHDHAHDLAGRTQPAPPGGDR